MTFTGWFLIVLGILTGICIAVGILENAILIGLGWGIWTVYLAVGLIYINTSKRFRKEMEENK